MLSSSLLEKLKEFLRMNFYAPFVIGFFIMLLVSFFSTIVGNEILADKSATYGYVVLVIGVLLQLFSVVKEKKENNVRRR